VPGAHIEKDAQGGLFPWESTHHPHERPLQMTKEELLALPPALDKFNGLVLQNSLHILLAMAAGAIIVATAVIVLLVRFIRRRRGVARGQSRL
jgi:hydroxyacylglutathione hydrolase